MGVLSQILVNGMIFNKKKAKDYIIMSTNIQNKASGKLLYHTDTVSVIVDLNPVD